MSRRILLTVAIAGVTLAGCSSMATYEKKGAGGKPAIFIDATEKAGIKTEGARSAGWADFDNDGCVDLLVTQASGVALYKNNCNGTFSDVTSTAGMSGPKAGIGIAWADYDGDGDLDVYIANSNGANVLYRNDGRGRFSDVSSAAGVDDSRAATAASWADMDGDGDLDLYVANRFYPRKDSDITDNLFRNNGNGTFTDVGKELGVAVPDRKSFMGVWFDYDRNGTLDLYLAVDFADDILFSNDGKGHFTNVSAAAGITGPAHAMGLAVGDINGDGCLDLISTNNTRGEPENKEHGPSTLYVNNCDGTFNDRTASWGLRDRGTVDWSVGFVDWDNDGDQDVAIVAGGMLDKGELENNVLYENRDGRMTEVTAYLNAEVNGAAFGGAWADYDNDGDLDWFIANSKKPSVLLENRAAGGHFLNVRLKGRGGNTYGVGALVEITVNGKTQVRTIQAGKGYAVSEELLAHFGLGDSDRIDSLKVTWTDGKVSEFKGLKANQTIVVTKGSS